MITYFKGDLIKAALAGEMDAIVHSTNCWNKQKKGFSLQMVHQFGTDLFPLEDPKSEGDMNKLGQIDFRVRRIKDNASSLWVVNAYCQYHWENPSRYGIPLDYDAFRLCFRKINSYFKKSFVGIPDLIGCGLAGGDPKIVIQIIDEECTDCEILIFSYSPGINNKT